MEMHKTMDGRATLAMTGLCLVWSMQQIGLKATADAASPILQVALRSGLAAVLVLALMRMRREPVIAAALPWRAGLGAGLLFALEYLLLGAGLQLTSAAHGAVFLYTGPLFAAVGLHFRLRSERLAPLQWLGIGLAFAGIVVTFLRGAAASGAVDPGAAAPGAAAPGAGTSLAGDALCLLAGAAWGATTVLVRTSRLAQAPATQTTVFQLLVAFVLLTIAAALLGQWHFQPTPLVLANLAFQTLVVSVASLLLWFALLRRYLASRLGAFSFLTPLFGVGLGAWLLDERISPTFLAGAVLVVAGIVLVSCHGWLAARLPAPAQSS